MLLLVLQGKVVQVGYPQAGCYVMCLTDGDVINVHHNSMHAVSAAGSDTASSSHSPHSIQSSDNSSSTVTMEDRSTTKVQPSLEMNEE